MFGGLERPRNGLGGGVGAVKSTVPASSTSTSTSTGKDNVPIASKIEEIEEDDEETQVGDGGKGSTTGMPIHTISLSAKKASSSSSASSLGSREPGHASLNDLLSSDDDGHDDEDEDGSDEFYANESGDEYDDDEDEEIDIDAALEAREAALAYHEKRMAIGAGAGTGPLGGDAAPDAFDAWNQAVSTEWIPAARVALLDHEADGGVHLPKSCRTYRLTLRCKDDRRPMVEPRDSEPVDSSQLR